TAKDLAVMKKPEPALSVAFSSVGGFLAVGTGRTQGELKAYEKKGIKTLNEVWLYDSRVKDPQGAWKIVMRHADAVTNLTLSEAGRLASAGRDGRIQVYDLASGSVRGLRTEGHPVRCLASLRGDLLASCDDARSSEIRIWHTGEGARQVHSIAGHVAPVCALT